MPFSFWKPWTDTPPRKSARRPGRTGPLRLERLEDRLAPATDITIFNGQAGTGSLDFLLTGGNSTINATDGPPGPASLSTGALQGLSGINDIHISAENSITFNDLGGTLLLPNVAGFSASFTAQGGAITFLNPQDSQISTQGGDLNLTAATSLQAGNLNSGGGNITLASSGLELDGTVASVPGITTLTNSTPGAPIDLGESSQTVGTLGLPQDTLNQVQASLLRIGDPSVGAITISAPVQTPTSSPLSLINNDAIGELNGGSLIADGLRISSTGSVSITSGSNSVGILAANVTGSLAYTDAGSNLGVGTVDGVKGITTGNSPITLQANDLSFSQPINAGTAKLTVQPLALTGTVDLGTDSAGSLSLTQADLAQVTAGILDVEAGGSVTISDAINLDPAKVPLLNVGSAGLRELAGGSVTVSSLTLNESSAASLPGNNVVGTLSAAVSQGDFSFTNSGDLVVSGAAAAGGNVALTTQTGANTGALRINGTVSAAGATAGTGTITLSAAGAGTEGPLGSVQAQGLVMLGNGSFNLPNSSNQVSQVAGSTVGSMLLDVSPPSGTPGNTILITNVNGTNGLTSTAGSITLTADSTDPTVTKVPLTVSAPVSAAIGVTLTAHGADAFLTSTSPIAGATVTLIGDRMDLGRGTITTPTGKGNLVSLQTFTVGRLLNLGDNGDTAANTLQLSAGELATITTSTLRVGNTSSGNLTITLPILNPTYTTLSLFSGGSITTPGGTGGAEIDVPNLAVQGLGGVDLEGLNNVSTFAGNVTQTAAALSFRASGNLSVGTVDGVNGVTSISGAVSIVSNAGSLTVTDTPAKIDVLAGGGLLALQAGPGQLLVNSANAHLQGRSIALTADGVDLQAGSIIDAGSSTMTISAERPGQGVNLGGPNADTALGLTAAELNTITAGTLTIATSPHAVMAQSASIAPAHVTTLVLQSGASLTQAQGATLTVNSLAVSAVGPVKLDQANSIPGAIAASISGLEQGFLLNATSNLTVATVAGLAGINTDNGTITVSAGGSLTVLLNSQVLAGTEVINLSARNGIVLQSHSTIRGGPVKLLLGHGGHFSGLLAGTSVDVTGGTGNDALVIDYAAGAVLPVGMTFDGRGGANTIELKDTGSNRPHAYTLNSGLLLRDGPTRTLLTNVQGVIVDGGNKNDTFSVSPSITTSFTVHGGQPGPSTPANDRLSVSTTGFTRPALSDFFSSSAGFTGQWTFGNARPIKFDGMETLLPTAHLVVSMSASPTLVAVGQPLTFTIRIRNEGPSPAFGAALTTATPLGTTFQYLTQLTGPRFRLNLPSVGQTGLVTATGGNLAVGATAVFQMGVLVNPHAMLVSTKATARVTSRTADALPPSTTTVRVLLSHPHPPRARPAAARADATLLSALAEEGRHREQVLSDVARHLTQK